MSVQTEPRFTRDLDLVVSVEGDPAAEDLVRGFIDVGYSVSALVESDVEGRLAIAQLEHDDGLLLDLLFASSGIEAEVVADAEEVEVLPGLVLPVASVGHLIALKLLSVDDRTRPQDRVDLAALRRAADDADLRLAAEAVDQIANRGYARGRDLESDLSALR